MCGIVAVWRGDKMPAHKIVARRYEQQKTRGQDGYGFIAIEGGKVRKHWRGETEEQAREALKNETAPAILFHHRLPTSTDNLAPLNHPIKIMHKSFKSVYYLLHNGVIRNASELREEHAERGLRYSTEVQTVLKVRGKLYATDDIRVNDSEALGIELALVLEGKKETVDTEGAVAFILLETDKRGRVRAVHYGRNTQNPLHIEKHSEIITLASESENKNAEMVAPNIIFTDRADGTSEQKVIDIGQTYTKPATIGYKTNEKQWWDREDADEITTYCWLHEKYDTCHDKNRTNKIITEPPTTGEEYGQLELQEAQLEELCEIAFQAQEWEEYEELAQELEIVRTRLAIIEEALDEAISEL